jgi:aminopeptidase N
MSDNIRSLTRVEAEERKRLVSVDRYDIDVDMTGLQHGTTWHATSTTTFTCSAPGVETFVDCVAEVRSATLNGRPVPAEHIEADRIRLTDLAEHNVLVVEVAQDNTASQQGIQRCVDASDGRVYVWTSFEPDDARRAWACFDQPDLKAPHAFTVLAPADWTVLSNSPAGPVAEHEGGRRWTFPDTPALSPYVVVVNAGPFHEIRSRRDGHDLGLYCRQSLAPFLDRDAEELFGLTTAGLAFFGEQFGRPFPQEKYDHVFISDMAGAMENWGCVTWGDFSLYRTTPTERERAYRAEILLHEMAHMWFGDLVTMQWWDDLWLNEAFASWAAAWACANATEFTEAWASFLTLDKPFGYAADRARNTHPIRQPATDVAEATATFDSITYVKGASVLKQLVAYVGEEAFLEGLRAYFTEHAWGNTTLADLMGAVGQAAGRDLAAWTRSWLDRAGTDRIVLERTEQGALLRVTAPATSPDAAPCPHRLDVGVYTAAGDGWQRTALVPVETTGGVTPVELPEGDLYLLNDEDLTFASGRLDERSRELAVTRPGGLPSTMARAVAVGTAWDMLGHAEAAARDFVRCAVDALRHETDASIASVVLGRALSAAELWSPAAEQESLLTTVADLAAELAERPALRTPALRVLARAATRDEHVERVRAALEADPAETELGWTLLTTLAGRGHVDEREVAALAARDRDPDSWIQELAVRAALPDPTAKEEAWRACFEDARVPSDRYFDIASAFWRRGQEALLRDYTKRFLDMLGDLSGGHLKIMVAIRAFFPGPVGDAELLAAIEDMAQDPRTSPIVRLNLVERADGLERMLRAREL